ncbi:MAG: hypothetical protein KDD35_03555, partial [Bdellovibrionales bacterium]|nr:hypothetical protein [Bdellovibrionales bacterium]
VKKEAQRELQALQPFIDLPKSEAGLAALRMVKEETLTKIDEYLAVVKSKGGARRSSYRKLFDRIMSSLATLTAVAIQSQSTDAGEAVRNATYLMNRAVLLGDLAAYLDVLKEPDPESGAGLSSLMLRLYRSPEVMTEALDLVKGHTTPEERRQIIPNLRLASGVMEGTSLKFTTHRAMDFATRVYQIDHPGEVYVPNFGTHPLLGKLFGYGGKRLRVVMNDAANSRFEGRFLTANDIDLDTEGSEAKIKLVNGLTEISINLSQVSAIYYGATQIYDSSKDGVVAPRVFSGVTPQDQELAAVIQEHARLLVSDYHVDFDEAGDLITSSAVIQQRTKKPLIDLLTEVLSLKEKGVAASPIIVQALVANILGQRVLEILDMDVGPKKQYEAAYLAVGLAERHGYKLWDIEVADVLKGDASDLLNQITARGAEDMPTWKALMKGPTELRKSIVVVALEVAKTKTAEVLSKIFPALDERLKPAVIELLGAERALDIAFMTEEQLKLWRDTLTPQRPN